MALDGTKAVKVSVLILTYNEEINIRNCLNSLCGLDDILVVDSGSTDATCSIAEKMGARVKVRQFDNFANQRNYGLDYGEFRYNWVLHLDADEVLTPEFKIALGELMPSDALDGYRVPSKLILDGRWLRYAGMYPTYQVRLGHRDRLRFKQVGHGQRENCPPSRISTFHEPYLHFNFSHGIARWFIKHVRYAEDESQQYDPDILDSVLTCARLIISIDSTRRRRALKQLVCYLPVWLRPPLRFLQVLFLRRGLLDGYAGLQYALMLSAYEAMIASFELRRRASKADNAQ